VKVAHTADAALRQLLTLVSIWALDSQVHFSQLSLQRAHETLSSAVIEVMILVSRPKRDVRLDNV